MGRGALRDSGEGFPRSGLLHSDGPRCVADLLEVGHGIARGSGPVRNGVRSLGAVEVDDQLIADVEALDRLLGLDEREGADLTDRVEAVLTAGAVRTILDGSDGPSRGRGGLGDEGLGEITRPGRRSRSTGQGRRCG